MRTLCLQKFTYVRFFIWLCTGVLAACASNNRPSHITSIGAEDLTRKKPVNVIIYHESKILSKTNKFDSVSTLTLRALESLSTEKRISLNKTASHSGDWLSVADQYFDDKEYNWTLRYRDTPFPEIGFQNFSTDIDSSSGVHFRYCKERTIQFANLSKNQLSEKKTYWEHQFYSAAIQSLYLLMKGKTSDLLPIQIRDYHGKIVNGTILGETGDYMFVLDGETFIYIIPKNIETS